MGCSFEKGLLDGAKGQAADELLLAEPAEHHDGRNGHQGGGRQLGPEQAFGAGVLGDQRGQGAGKTPASVMTMSIGTSCGSGPMLSSRESS